MHYLRKLSAEHGQELHPHPKFLVMAEAHLSATFGPNFSDFFDLCLHWVFVVCGLIGNKICKLKSLSPLLAWSESMLSRSAEDPSKQAIKDLCHWNKSSCQCHDSNRQPLDNQVMMLSQRHCNIIL